nr:MAG: hypothetical protein [Apis mellifera filamentous virus]
MKRSLHRKPVGDTALYNQITERPTHVRPCLFNRFDNRRSVTQDVRVNLGSLGSRIDRRPIRVGGQRYDHTTVQYALVAQIFQQKVEMLSVRGNTEQVIVEEITDVRIDRSDIHRLTLVHVARTTTTRAIATRVSIWVLCAIPRRTKRSSPRSRMFIQLV